MRLGNSLRCPSLLGVKGFRIVTHSGAVAFTGVLVELEHSQ